SSVADLDGDGRSELLLGERVHEWNGALRWDRPDLRPIEAVAIADFDLDCRPEIVAVANKRAELYLLDPQTGATIAVAQLPGGVDACPPAILGQGGSP